MTPHGPRLRWAVLALASLLPVLSPAQATKDPLVAADEQTAPTQGPQLIPKVEPRPFPPYAAPALAPQTNTIFTLPMLIDLAERKNTETRIGWEAVQQAAAKAGESRSALFPMLDFTTTAIKARVLFIGSPPASATSALTSIDATLAEPSLQVSYDMDIGGSLNAYRAAKHALASARASLNVTHEQVALDVSKQYYEFLNAEEEVRAASANEEDSRLNRDSAELKYRNGLTTIVALYQARSRYLQANASLIKARGQEADARIALAVLTGLNPEEALEVASLDSAPPAKVIEQTAQQLAEHALKTRPELLRDAEKIKSSEATVHSKRAGYLPSFGVQGQAIYLHNDLNIGTTDPTLGTLGASPNARSYIVQGNLKWSLFDGGKVRNSVRLAQSQVREDQARLDDTKLQVQQEVYKAYVSLLSLLRDQDAAKVSLDAATEAWKAAQIASSTGQISDLDLSSAKAAFVMADTQYAEARANTLKAAAQLAYSTGDLLSAGQEQPEPVGGKP